MLQGIAGCLGKKDIGTRSSDTFSNRTLCHMEPDKEIYYSLSFFYRKQSLVLNVFTKI